MSGDERPTLDLAELEDAAPATVAVDAAALPAPPSPVEELSAVYEVPVQLSAVLGKATMPVSQLLRLGRGAVLELDRKVGESIDILVNNRLVARGEVVIVDDRIGVTMTEIIKSDA
jgi:flagellar motor switch protein FliN/FliY